MADIGIQNIVDLIIASSSDYLVEYSPVFIFVIAFVFAMAVIGALIDKIFPEKEENNVL